jgi:hypothetical protein
MSNQEQEITETLQEDFNQEPEQEKMLSQSEVNRLIGKAKSDTASKYQRQLEEAQQSAGGGALSQDDEERLYQSFLERSNQERLEQQRQKDLEEASQAYLSKVSTGKTLFEDYDNVINENLNVNAFPEVHFLASQLEDPAAVIYELAQNPQKASVILNYAQRAPEVALKKMQEIEKSIIDNRQALEREGNQSVGSPLSRLSEGSLGASGSGRPSVSDLKKMDWMRT